MKKLKLTFIQPEYQFELHPGICFPKPPRDLQEGFGNIWKSPAMRGKVSVSPESPLRCAGRFRYHPKVPRDAQEGFGIIGIQNVKN